MFKIILTRNNLFTSGYLLCDWSRLLMTGATSSPTTDTLRLGLAPPGAEVGLPRLPTRRDLRCRVKRIPAAAGEVRRSLELSTGLREIPQ